MIGFFFETILSLTVPKWKWVNISIIPRPFIPDTEIIAAAKIIKNPISRENSLCQESKRTINVEAETVIIKPDLMKLNALLYSSFVEMTINA